MLLDELAFEVRWAVAGESIVMQLVGRVGKFIYIKYNKHSIIFNADYFKLLDADKYYLI